MDRRMTHLKALTLCAALSLGLNACGGGGDAGGSGSSGGSPPPPPETLFVPANAWNGPMPADATMLTAEDFRSRVKAGTLLTVATGSDSAQATARQQQLEQDRAFLAGLADQSQAIKDLLAELDAGAPQGDRAATLPNGQRVVLQDMGTRLHDAAEHYRISHDVASARDTYAHLYQLLPAGMQGQVPAPATLDNATLEQVGTAADQLDAAFSAESNLDNVRLDPESLSPGNLQVQALALTNNGRVRAAEYPDDGTDNNGPCKPTGLYAQYWFPLKYFISPVKDQGQRGHCWAFAALGAVESRELVQNNNAADLSEQFLVHLVKLQWDHSDYADGYSSEAALNAAVDRNQVLAPESYWKYNPAPNRVANAFDDKIVGTADSYLDVCMNYTNRITCSSTAHESHHYCTTQAGTNYCGYDFEVYQANDPGAVVASRARQIWANGDTFELNTYRALLANGYTLLASLPVYVGIWEAPNTGMVADYSRQMRDKDDKLVDGSYGGHAVQIVGFLSNEDLTTPATKYNVGGGGYFIIRNSWGCRGGDGGYYYVPADYVSSIFNSLSVLDFDSRRGSQWTEGQVFPGADQPLQLNWVGSTTFDLRVSRQVAPQIILNHPVAGYAQLTVTSDKDGLLYSGQWLINAPLGVNLFSNSLFLDFPTEGARRLTLTAHYGSQQTTLTQDVLVINTPPTITLTGGTPQQGVNFSVQALVNDINEPDTAAMCDASVWSVDAPDAVVGGGGCLRTIQFGASGNRQVRVTTFDTEGLRASAIGTYAVSPAPVNPYPSITSFGVYSSEYRAASLGQTARCVSNPVANGLTVDLREAGCLLLAGPPPRYSASVVVDNPQNEVLSYDWTYSTYFTQSGPADAYNVTHTTTPSYTMTPVVFGFLDTAYRCDLVVRVNAPDPSRSKTQTVWSGKCINIYDAPH
jgi:Papain family cysteine protease